MKSLIDELLTTGWYSKPHGLLAMLKGNFITKSEYIMLDFLLAHENRHMNKEGWFWCCDKNICATGLLSSRSVVKARRSLKQKGLIEFKKGNSHRATEYQILIEKKHYYRGQGKVENESELVN